MSGYSPEQQRAGGQTVLNKYGREHFREMGRRSAARKAHLKAKYGETFGEVEGGRKGGQRTLQQHGVEHFQRIAPLAVERRRAWEAIAVHLEREAQKGK